MRTPPRCCKTMGLPVAFFVAFFLFGLDAATSLSHAESAAQAQASSPQAASDSSFTCPVTTPNRRKYTEAELAPLQGRRGWMTTTNPDGTKTTVESPLGNHGNDALSTGLYPEGKVVFQPGGPGFVLEDGSLSMKFWWWRLVRGRLTIEGRRLDGPAPPLRARIPGGYSGIGFQATGLIFPTPGCWEVTGRVGERTLTFVTLAEKIGNGPSRWPQSWGPEPYDEYGC